MGSVVVAPFPVTFQWLWRCVSLWRQIRWPRNKFEERMSTFVPTPALLWHSHSTWQGLEDTRNALVVSRGDVQIGDRGRSKETLRALACRRDQLLSARRCTFEHCTSFCPSRDATMVVLTKKKKKTPNAAYHCTKKIFWGSVPTSEARCSLKSAVWRRIEWVHQSANDKTTTWPPAAGSAWKSCFDQLGHDRSAVIIQRCAACHEFPRSFLVAAIIFPHTKWLKKITDYRDTPALKYKHEIIKKN